MRQQQETRRPAAIVVWRFLSISMTLLLVLGSAPLLSSSSAALGRLVYLPRKAITSTAAASGAFPWDGDTLTTAPTFDFSAVAATSQQLEVSPLFAGYYQKHSGATSLGPPLTAAFLTGRGWMQFFASGALLLPVVQARHLPDAGDGQDPLVALIDAGTRDPATGILRLSLLQVLLAVGSQVPVVGDSALTYVDLRAAATSDAMVPAPEVNSITGSRFFRSRYVFVQGGMRAGTAVGHLVPLPIWSYIQRADVSPDGWQTDFGAPLTEALTFSVVRGGVVHQMLVQAFWNDAVILDQSALDSASVQPSVSRLESGVAYLRTLGPPPVVVDAGQPAWARVDTALLSTPGTGQAVEAVEAVAHVGQAFPLTLEGSSAWQAGRLWYQVRWTTPHRTFTAWAQAADLTFTSPGQVPVRASIDALSPELAASLAGEGGSVGVAVYDLTRGRYYTWGADGQFITGSSIKVAIMLTLLDLTEREGREPDADELALLTAMIENSDNEAAATLYYGEVGGAAAVAGYMQSIGIAGLDPDPDAYGWSLVTPLAMVKLLTRLEQGTVLTAQDRDLALSLMENIEPDQQVGVGDTAPPGATVAMKDGWVPGPDGLWTMNSSGIVTLGRQTYVIAVYTQEQPSLEDGQGIARSICQAVAALLT